MVVEAELDKCIRSIGFGLQAVDTAHKITGAEWSVIVRAAAMRAPMPGVFLRINKVGRVLGEFPFGGFAPGGRETGVLAQDQSQLRVYRDLCGKRHSYGIVMDDDAHLNLNGTWTVNRLHAEAVVHRQGEILVLITEQGNSHAYQRRGTLWDFHCRGCGGKLITNGQGGICPNCQTRYCDKGHCQGKDCPGPNVVELDCAKCWERKNISQFPKGTASLPKDKRICLECLDGMQ
ncbi:hypothetical protein COO72_11290 [Bifidobacterium callitrichos]|nr:hypothetical protein COO72_11290 [Bifidobacterium callitrichos]